MTMTVLATYENGLFKPKQPLRLAEGAEVQLTVQPMQDDADPLGAVIGIGESSRTDGADQHNHYIYGTPSDDLRR